MMFIAALLATLSSRRSHIWTHDGVQSVTPILTSIFSVCEMANGNSGARRRERAQSKRRCTGSRRVTRAWLSATWTCNVSTICNSATANGRRLRCGKWF